MKRIQRWLALCLYGAAILGVSAAKPLDDAWPAEVREVRYVSAADDSLQPALFYAPADEKPVPLLVGLHTWSSDYRQKSSAPYADWCIEKGWAFVHPNFRGPNVQPDACGSELVVQDILSAVAYAREHVNVDASRIYVVGASGGGYASLLMAGRAPELWAGVSAWVPINDLQAWYFETRERGLRYADQVMNVAGGIPFDGTPAAASCDKRSAKTYLANAKGLPVDINAGIHDGHTGSVPVSHTLHAFNILATPSDQIGEDAIAQIVAKEVLPKPLGMNVPVDELYGEKKVLFRRQSGNARVTLFEGGHEIIPEAALTWLSQQQKK